MISNRRNRMPLILVSHCVTVWEIQGTVDIMSRCQTFPKAFSQEATLQEKIPKWRLPKLCNIPSGNFLSLSQPQCSVPLHVLAAALGLLVYPSRSAWSHCSLWRLRRPNLTFGKMPLGKCHIWEDATWEIVMYLGNPFGKVPNTNCSDPPF